LTASSAAVLVPSQSLELTPAARISFERLRRVLATYDTFLVVPDTVRGTLDGLPTRSFPARYFGSLRAHQALITSSAFYCAFDAYEFVLIHHLDSLALADELQRWCDEGWDSIGAPWTRRTSEGAVVLTGAGNGGFTLRRVESCIRIATMARRPDRRARVALGFAAAPGHRAVTHGARRPRAALSSVRSGVSAVYLTEDKFWSEHAPRIDPSFRVAPAEVALRFAFETNPRECFELNDRRLPFGCHKWWLHDREFWETQLRQRAE